MKIHIVGAGAIGGLTGAFLIQQGVRVHFIDVVAEHVAAINSHGLLVDGISGEFRVSADASLPEAIRGPLDMVLLSVKSQHTDQAMDQIEPLLNAGSLVISLQNGLNSEKIANRIGLNRTGAALINFSADYIEPGHIRYGGSGDYYIGKVDGSADHRLEMLANLLRHSMNVIVTDNIQGYLWSKECYGCLLVATALANAPIYEVIENPHHRDVISAALTESVAVADAYDVHLEPFFPFDPTTFRYPAEHSQQDAFYEHASNRYKHQVKQYSGIWRDLHVRHRKSEVEWLTGELVRRGDALGIRMPINRRVVEMISEIEQGTRSMSPKNLDEIRLLLGT